MSQEVRGNDAPFILNAVERAIIRVPRSSHHGLTKIATAVKIAGRTYLDLSLLTDINMSRLPEVVLAARLYHLALTHRSWRLPASTHSGLTATCRPLAYPQPLSPSSTSSRSVQLPAVSVGTHHFPAMTIKPNRIRRLPPTADARGLLIENLEAAQLTVARTSSNPRSAFTQLCMIGNSFTHFDNFHLTDSRRHEKYWKELLRAELIRLGNSVRGRSQAQWIITHADAGVHPPRSARTVRAVRRGH